MRQFAARYGHGLGSLTLCLVASLWSGCAEEASDNGGGGSTATETTGGTGGTGGTGAEGAQGGAFTDGGGGEGAGGVCVATVEQAEPTQLDMLFMIDWSRGMQGESWEGTKAALQTFFEDPVSEGINAGMVFAPTVKPFGDDCDTNLYKILDVPIGPLPENSFELTNAMPQNALGGSTPLSSALRGVLMAATAYQDAHPTHKVVVVMTGDGGGAHGGANTCGPLIDEIAGWVESARNYNGVETYVIGVQSESIYFDNLDILAEAGGTGAYYDAQNIEDFSARMEEIRRAALGCEFAIPPPPAGQDLVPDEVNFMYAPGGENPFTVPRADDLADCGDAPGWYYDDNDQPTKIIVCPASCATIQNDPEAAVAAAFGCASELN